MKVGTKFVVNTVPAGLRNVTAGKEYVIAGYDIDNEPFFVNDAGVDCFAVGHADGWLETAPGLYTIVPEE